MEHETRQWHCENCGKRLTTVTVNWCPCGANPYCEDCCPEDCNEEEEDCNTQPEALD